MLLHVCIARHLPVKDESYSLPRPIILDTDLRTSTSCKLLANYQQSRGRRPWIVCNDVSTAQKCDRKKALEQAGARVLEVTSGQGGAYHIRRVC